MKCRAFHIFLLLVFLFAACKKDEPVKPLKIPTLVNPKASKEAKNVYSFLHEKKGKKILSGVQSAHSYTNDYVNLVYQETGKHPALAGYDFIFLHFSPTPSYYSWVRDYSDISAMEEQWTNNGLISYMWHWNVPTSEQAWRNGKENYNFDGYAFYSDQTSFDIHRALQKGTWENRFLMDDIGKLASYLQLLEDANIPVIWRPLHEAAGNYNLYGGNGAWFWWGRGGPEACKTLWKLLYNQLVNVYGLDNLIWVWTVDVPEGIGDQYLEWYPGDEYVDILGVDIYAQDIEIKARQYYILEQLAKGKKLIALSECGNIPDPDRSIMARHAWSWFMVWPIYNSNGNLSLNSENKNFNLNTLDYWNKVMNGRYVLNREDMPSLK